MGPKYKVTGCARFFLFFIIFVPIVFFGAAYFRGENGVEIIKDNYHKIFGGKESASVPSGKGAETYPVEELQKQLKVANEKIEKLEQRVEEQEKEIEKLKGVGK
jgi:hypothetical protein